jgi:hypothetical protein
MTPKTEGIAGMRTTNPTIEGSQIRKLYAVMPSIIAKVHSSGGTQARSRCFMEVKG